MSGRFGYASAILVFLFGMCLAERESALPAPSVNNIRAIQHDGQTFITWQDAAAGVSGARYRYDLYRSTAGPIKDLTHATLVEQGIYNNSAQLIGPKPYSQATRQNPALRMSIIQEGGQPLPPWSGLAVYTDREAASAYYAVITRDTSGTLSPSVLSTNNSLGHPVTESMGNLRPVLQLASTDESRNPGCCSISGQPSLPFWLRLHGSGGSALPVGDLQAYWGDSTMGHQDGIQSMFSMYEDRTGGGIVTSGERQLIMSPQDAVWSLDGNFGSETFWYGYRDIPFGSGAGPHVFPYTKTKLSFIVPWAIAHYRADPNRIYGISKSMGGYGHLQWSLQQPGLFAAIFMRVPILAGWRRIPSLIDLMQNGSPKTVLTGPDTLPDDRTSYNDDTDVRAWVAQDCSRNLPYLSWSSGRRDGVLDRHRMWYYAVEMAQTLKQCHYGFSFIWSNGMHDGITAEMERTLLQQYQTVFARNLSYPAFTNFSLDANYGNGDPQDGDPTGCVNCGWLWKIVSDTPSSWSTSFTNTQLSRTARTDVTPRNTQHFKCSPGQIVKWFSSTRQHGELSADAYGLVTVTGLELNSNAPTLLTLNLQMVPH